MVRFSREKELDIITRYARGESQLDIAKSYKTFNTSIRRILLRNGVVLRSQSQVARLCKHSPFRKKDEISSYFVGLLVTDGCIAFPDGRTPRLDLSLSERDKYMVKFFRDWISPDQKVSRSLQKRNQSYMYSCKISNADVVDWLCKKANFIDKSHNAKLYMKINKHVLRGIFDGDGGFAKANKYGLTWYVCGLSESLINQIHSYLAKVGIKSYISFVPPGDHQKSGLYYVKVHKYVDVLRLGLLMYSDAHVFLNRKYVRWLAFYENKKNKYDLNSGKAGIANPERNLPTPHEVKYKVGRDVQRL